MNCGECDRLMADALYGELEGEAKGRFEAHVQSCRDCARLFGDMRSTLSAMDRRERVDPGQAYWDGYWNRLTARMEREGVQRRDRSLLGRLLPSLSPSSVKWALRGTLAVLLVVFGAVVGRIFLPAGVPGDMAEVGPEGDRPGTATVRQATAEDCARQYIEDSQILLLSLVNFDTEAAGEFPTDWSAEKQRSRELAAQAASLRADLDGPKHRRLRELVGQLELIMIQIANLETAGDLEAVDLIRSSVDDQDVMLKINLEKLRGAEKPEPEQGACDA